MNGIGGKRGYYLGLDMGTDSVGWAVADCNYNLIRAKGKDLWGVREFEAANTSAERRSYRTSRRRKQRSQVRIGLLKNYFKDEIDKVDANFYESLENSFFKKQDKSEKARSKNLLFNDSDFKDKDYYNKYPTAFHLRSELVHNSEAHDVRLVFLALLNIYKHRGHFLNESLSETATSISVKDTYENLVAMLIEKTDIQLPEEFNENEFEEIMCDRGLSRSEKDKRTMALLKIDSKEKDKHEIIKALSGLKVDAKKMFSIESDEKIDFCFADAGFEDKQAELETALGDDFFSIVVLMKQIYDACAWDTIIKGFDYISDARIALYEKHAQDLKVLKMLLKQKGQEAYDRFFRTEEDGTYGDYVGSTVNDGKVRRRGGKKHTREDFYKAVKTELKGINNPLTEQIENDIDNGTFMPLQLNRDNGIIPYQAHYKELDVILNNAEKYLPFLAEKDKESGLTVSEQIKQIFKFKIPYFVGPVTEDSQKNNGNGWVVRKENGPVRPWNIDSKINIEKTSEEFINRLIRKCTYISGERVLPKSSLLFEKYAVLNAINVITIDGERISVDLKQEVYRDLFCKGSVVTKDKIAKYFVSRGLITSKDQISGMDDRINNTLAFYHRYYMIFGNELKKDSCKQMVEEIIRLCTIFGDSKKELKRKLEKEYGDRITHEQLKKILGIKCKDWGNLSKAFLELRGAEKCTGEIMTLIDALWNTKLNLMELINSDEFTFKKELNNKMENRLKPVNEMVFEDLDDMYLSAPVKRMVWQTLLVIRELEKVLGSEPKKVFVEMTRGDGEKVRTKSRKDMFTGLYKAIKEDTAKWLEIIGKAESDGTIKSKKMYLFLQQKGQDMYTGKPISIDDLFNDNLYDIDHIYPQSLTKDDNLDNNMILVNKNDNNNKQNVYPLSEDIRRKCSGLWKELHDQKFINDEKYKRLTGCNPLTDEQLEGFISRQLVETSQGTKAVAKILAAAMPDSKIVYSKAKVVSDFRKKYELFKSRSINDFHHANDAYLNIVVGNAYLVKFTDNPKRFIHDEFNKDKEKYKYNLAKFFDYDVKRGNEVAWVASNKNNENGTILTVKKVMKRATPLLTRMNFEAHGGISDQTLYGADTAKEGVYLPIKGKDDRYKINEYGGYNKVSTAYFFLVESEVKGKKVRTLETVPIYLAKEIENDPKKLEEYCVKTLGLVNPDIRLRKIRLQSLIKKNKYFLNITGKTLDRITLRNATSMILDQKWVNYIKKIEKYIETGNVDKNLSIEKNLELYKVLIDKHKGKVFSNRPVSVVEKFEEKYGIFQKRSMEEQLKALAQFIGTTAIVATAQADMTVLNDSKSDSKTAGALKMSKKIDPKYEFFLVNQSVTGIYEEYVDLHTI